MKKNDHIIVLNGRRYDARTGADLSPQAATARPHAGRRHAPGSKPAHAARQPARHLKAHAPETTRTLMRHGVKKPSAGTKRRIRVQARLDSQIKQPDIRPARPSGRPARHRTTRGRQVHLISHFSPNLFTAVTITAPPAKPASRPLVSERPAANHDVTPRPTMRPAFAPRKPRTTAELLEYAVRYAYSPPAPETPARKRHARRHGRRHARVVAH